jgi:hypothetical protein
MVGSDENRKYGLFKKILKKIYEFEECVNGLLQFYVSDFVS